MPKFPLSETIANFAATVRPEALTDRAAAIVKTGIVDYAGALLAGRNEDAVRILRDYDRQQAKPSDEATVLFGAERASAESAALINGTAGHALSYDDVAFMAHPSTVLVSAIMAEGERLHRSGREVMLAYLVGYEVWGELTSRE